MIKTFEVENFRLFDQIKIKRISNVNLIVGKNNAGKSALLEALLLYVSKVSPDVIMKLISSRQEHWTPSLESYSGRLATNPIRHLFKNHKLPSLTESGFKLSSENDVDSIHVKTAAFIQEETEQHTIRRKLTLAELEYFESDSYEVYLISEHGENTLRVLPLQDSFKDIRRKMMFRGTKSDTSPYQFVPTIGIDDYTVASLWDNISLTDLESEVIKGLKLLDQSVSAIAFVASDASREPSVRIPLVKMENVEEPVPLKSLGDGMTHVFQIILALVSSKNGTLIIDEFENGLHWSIQQDVWRMVFELSDKLNVQVFSSTHSTDCVKGFEKAWSANEDKGAFLRVYKEDGAASLKEYDLELLRDSIETEVEVR